MTLQDTSGLAPRASGLGPRCTSLLAAFDIRLDMPWKNGQRPKVVRENEATGTTADIYHEIRRALGLPFVPVPFQIFAAIPKFLELHWSAVGPMVATQEFFALAERVRADGYTRVHSYFRLP